MIFWCIPLVILCFMFGGQVNKLFRPIGVPLSIMSLYCIFYQDTFLVCLPALLYGIILDLGYGPRSRLMKLLKNEQWVRIISGLLVALPVSITVLFTGNILADLFIPVIVAVWCIRMGKWGTIGKFDILPVDIFRGLVLSLAISAALL